MIFYAPAIIIPPEKPAIVRASDLKGLPTWEEMQRREQKATFPFPLVPPTGIGGNDAYTKILLHMNGSNGGTTFTDSNAGGSAHTWTPTSATTDTGTYKFATASMNASGGSKYISTPNHADFTLGSSDFTLDAWFYVSGGNGTYRAIGGQGSSTISGAGSSSTAMRLSDSNLLQGLILIGTTLHSVTATTAITSAGWHHAALVRSVNNLLIFTDGILENTYSSFSGSISAASYNWAVGRWGEFTSQMWNGYVDEFRLSVGVARWTSNFSPPTSPYA